MALAAIHDPSVIYEAARLSGEELLGVGINFVLAPVLDINNNPQNPVIGVRSYGTDAETVCTMGKAAIHGFRDAGILCAGKHFPGHGDTSVDTHLDFALIHKGRAELKANELRPFEMAIHEKIPAIMAAHVAFAGEDGIPATLSHRIITELLRNEMQFDGMVISDCMEMDAIRAHFGVAEGVVQSVKAGVDMIIISRNMEDVRAALCALRTAVESGAIPMARIDQAVAKIMDCKRKYAGRRAVWNEELQQRSYARAEALYAWAVGAGVHPPKATVRLGTAPRFLSPIRQQVSLVTDQQSKLSLAEELAKQFGGSAREISLRPDDSEIEEIVQWAKDGSCIVAGCLNATVYKEQIELIKRLYTLDIPMVCAALRNPFELDLLPERVVRVPLYEYSRRAIVQLARRLLPGEEG